MKSIICLFAGTLLTCLALAPAASHAAAQPFSLNHPASLLVADRDDAQMRQQRELEQREKAHRANDRYQQEKMRRDQERMVREQRRMEREQARKNNGHWDNRRPNDPKWHEKERHDRRAQKEREQRARERQKHEEWRQDHRRGPATRHYDDGKYRPEELKRRGFDDGQYHPGRQL